MLELLGNRYVKNFLVGIALPVFILGGAYIYETYGKEAPKQLQKAPDKKKKKSG